MRGIEQRGEREKTAVQQRPSRHRGNEQTRWHVPGGRRCPGSPIHPAEAQESRLLCDSTQCICLVLKLCLHGIKGSHRRIPGTEEACTVHGVAKCWRPLSH